MSSFGGARCMRPTRLSEVRIQDAGPLVYRAFSQCLHRSGRVLIVQYSSTRSTLKMRSGSFYEREDDDDDDGSSVQSTHSTHTSSLGGASSITTHHHTCPRHRTSQPNSPLSIHRPVEATCDTHIWYLLLKVSMSVLMATGVAVLASFMYNFPIMQKVELKSLENALHKNLYCQTAAIEALMGHIKDYVERKHEGVVVLFLAGSEGSGKTLTVDTFREVNPKWKKIVATHEQGELNKLSQEQLINTVRGNIHTSTLNFLFIDDIPDLVEGKPFVEMKLKPILRSLKFEKTLVFLVITSYEGNTTLPQFLTNEYEHQTILYEAMPRQCVEKCALDVIRALDANPRYIDMKALMSRIHFDDVNGVQVAKDGCKTVPITVAHFLSASVLQQEREHESQYPEQEPNEL